MSVSLFGCIRTVQGVLDALREPLEQVPLSFIFLVRIDLLVTGGALTLERRRPHLRSDVA